MPPFITLSDTNLNVFFLKWESNKDKFAQQSTIIINAIQEHVNELGLDAKTMPKSEVIDKLFKGLSTSFDEDLGGFGGAPKFPQPGNVHTMINTSSERINGVLRTIY